MCRILQYAPFRIPVFQKSICQIFCAMGFHDMASFLHRVQICRNPEQVVGTRSVSTHSHASYPDDI
jgi:hypothetical protein